jgi:hypothetical protein
VVSVSGNPGHWLVVEGAFELRGNAILVGGQELGQIVRSAYANDPDEARLGGLRLTIEAAPEVLGRPAAA